MLARLTEPLPDSDRYHRDMQGSPYQVVFNLVKRYAGCDEKTFRKKAEWVGLLNQSGEDEDDENDVFRRYAESYVRIFTQVRMINAARLHIEDLLREAGVDLTDFEKTVGGKNGISPEDFFDLARWSDDLKMRIQLGVVDHTKGAAVRFQLGLSEWNFPKLPLNIPPERLTRALVDVVQRVRSHQLAPHDAALRKYVRARPKKSLQKIQIWYLEKRHVRVRMGALLDRLGRVGLSKEIAGRNDLSRKSQQSATRAGRSD